MEQATGEWLFYIDPDERLQAKLVDEIIDAVKDTSHSAFRLNAEIIILDIGCVMGVNILIHSCAFSVKARQGSQISMCMKNWWLTEASGN